MVSTIGLDLAKNVFQVHGVDEKGAVVVRKRLRRGQVLKFFSGLPRCVVAMEACASSHMRAAGNLIELVQMNFSFPPSGPKGGPVFNFRSEGRNFSNSNRCLVPASGFFEFTGTKYPKAKHRFTLNGQPFLAIAGIWREGQGNHPPSFTMLTTSPGPDIAPYHNRQVVVLRPADWSAWINLTKPQAELLKPLPGGSLNEETVRQGSD